MVTGLFMMAYESLFSPGPDKAGHLVFNGMAFLVTLGESD